MLCKKEKESPHQQLTVHLSVALDIYKQYTGTRAVGQRAM